MTAHTIVEDFKTEEDQIRNVEPHFAILWGARARVSLIMHWIRSVELYQNPEIVHLPGFQEYVDTVPLVELDDLIKRPEASLFYVRLMEGRIRKLEDQRTIVRLAERDLTHAFAINLGLLIENRAANEADYLRNLNQKRFLERERLSRILCEAVRLRDLVTAAYREGHLDEDLLPGLRLRIGALEEHYGKAQELLGERVNLKLVDRACEEWL
jgi:hypothetical protein